MSTAEDLPDRLVELDSHSTGMLLQDRIKEWGKRARRACVIAIVCVIFLLKPEIVFATLLQHNTQCLDTIVTCSAVLRPVSTLH